MSHLEDKSLPPQSCGMAMQFELSFMVEELKGHFPLPAALFWKEAAVDAQMKVEGFHFQMLKKKNRLFQNQKHLIFTAPCSRYITVHIILYIS